jgi:hypothetical protein
MIIPHSCEPPLPSPRPPCPCPRASQSTLVLFIVAVAQAVLELAAGGQKCWTAGEPWQLVLQGRQPIEACHAFKR